MHIALPNSILIVIILYIIVCVGTPTIVWRTGRRVAQNLFPWLEFRPQDVRWSLNMSIKIFFLSTSTTTTLAPVIIHTNIVVPSLTFLIQLIISVSEIWDMQDGTSSLFINHRFGWALVSVLYWFECFVILLPLIHLWSASIFCVASALELGLLAVWWTWLPWFATGLWSWARLGFWRRVAAAPVAAVVALPQAVVGQHLGCSRAFLGHVWRMSAWAKSSTWTLRSRICSLVFWGSCLPMLI